MTRTFPRDLIIFGDDWGRHPSSSQYLARHLAKDRKIIWVNSLGLRAPRLSWTDGKRIVGKLRSLAQKRPAQGQKQDCKPALSTPHKVIEPLALPFHGNALARQINRWSLRRQLHLAMHELQMENPILWISIPSGALAIDQVETHALVYYCADDFTVWPGTDGRIVRNFECDIQRHADLVFTVSKDLQQKFAHLPGNLLPHGVDFDFFSRPVAPAADLPNARPCAGFYGSTFDRLDQDLIAAIARHLPHWDFLFIGQVDAAIDQLKTLPNIYFPGRKPLAALTAYSQHWTASILPFEDSPEVRASNPLKLREYLAAGRPVVSTDFPAMDDYRDVVSVARDAADFAHKLELCRHEQGGAILQRQNRIRPESWQARAAIASQYLDALG